MISFIIPVYNKGSVLFKTLSSLIKHLKQSQIKNYEIIVVNDGSTDNSFSEAKRFKNVHGAGKKIRIFHYHKNIGKGFALRFGFSRSIGDPIVFVDADVDIDTNQVISAYHQYSRLQPHILVGSKYHVGSRIHYPLNRYLYSLVLKRIIRFLFKLNVSDTQVGLKIFQRSVLEQVLPRLIIKRFAVDLEILVVATMFGFRKIVEIPVIIEHSSANHSTIDIQAVRNFCQDIFAIWYRKNILNYYDSSRKRNEQFSIFVQTA